MTLYKGPIIDFIHTKGITHHASSSDPSQGQNWVAGTLMLLASCFGWSSFFILQVSFPISFFFMPNNHFVYELCLHLYIDNQVFFLFNYDAYFYFILF